MAWAREPGKSQHRDTLRAVAVIANCRPDSPPSDFPLWGGLNPHIITASVAVTEALHRDQLTVVV